MNTKFTHAKMLTKNLERISKTVTLFLSVLIVGLALSGCGQKPINEQLGATAAAEPAKDEEPLIADCNLPLDPNPIPDHSKSDDAAVKTEKPRLSDTPSDPGMIGYVVKKEDSNILVVSPKVRNFGTSTEDDDYYEAIWFSEAPEEIQVGMKVEAWATGGMVAESYPGQAGAEKVEVQNGDVLQGASFSEAEVVREAIEQLEPSEYSFFIVRAAKYHPDEEAWTVELLDEEREPVRIEIEDRAA